MKLAKSKQWYLNGSRHGVEAADPTTLPERLEIFEQTEVYLEAKSRRTKTISAHRLALRQFREFAAQEKRSYVDEIDKAMLRRWFEELIDGGNTPFTAANKILKVNSFYRTVMGLDPGKDITTKKDFKRELAVSRVPETYTRQDLDSLFSAMDPEKHSLFPVLAEGSILKPVLTWVIERGKAGHVNAQLSYITGGMDWDATYNVIEPPEGKTLALVLCVSLVGLARSVTGRVPHVDRTKINFVAEDSSGTIWATVPGSQSSLYRWHGGKWVSAAGPMHGSIARGVWKGPRGGVVTAWYSYVGRATVFTSQLGSTREALGRIATPMMTPAVNGGYQFRFLLSPSVITTSSGEILIAGGSPDIYQAEPHGVIRRIYAIQPG